MRNPNGSVAEVTNHFYISNYLYTPVKHDLILSSYRVFTPCEK